ncbi:MAG: NUDIX hydrolase [Gammaproteobacteria bacterium AqS3]|nr:NUDIX hydrolase [Gammaproteobacteria bacterium AqS3]
MSGEAVDIQPAATVMLLREPPDSAAAANSAAAAGGLEVLMVKRSRKLVFGPGIWVFPGGRLEAEDRSAHSDDVETAARIAAARETVEEAGVEVDIASMRLFAHWTTPPGPPRRYATWFFCARIDNEQRVRIDNDEIREHWWAHPRTVLERHAAGEVEMYEPTWMSLKLIDECADVASALAALEAQPVERFCGRMIEIPEGICHLYEGDAAYESGDLEAPGARRRLWARGSDWQFEDTATQSTSHRNQQRHNHD